MSYFLKLDLHNYVLSIQKCQDGFQYTNNRVCILSGVYLAVRLTKQIVKKDAPTPGIEPGPPA